MTIENNKVEVVGELDNEQVVNNDVWEEYTYFPTSVYMLKKPEFLETVKLVSEEYVDIIKSEKKLDDIYPVYMSENYFADPRMGEFSTYVGQTAWNILASQGYDMENFVVQYSEMWTQQHYKHSLMEEHTHGYGSVISGFYFLECPEECSRVVIHDPRPAKVITNLPEKDQTQISYGSRMINFIPEPGTLMFTNSWLPHSFSRHGSDKPMKFVHFNMIVWPAQQNVCETNQPEADSAEVI